MIRQVWLLAIVVLANCSLGMAQADKSQTLRTTDEIQAAIAGDVATLDIRSASGIGKGKVERAGDAWPKTVVLRLHLKGLESLSIRGGDVLLETYVSSSDPAKQYANLGRGGDEPKPIDRRSPYWPILRREQARAEDDTTKPATTKPATDGYFEITLPPKLLAENPRVLELHWVDFFRG
ncbi:MAG: hypothetical protein RIC55_19705 [Pirellulaceae bacterium]